MAFDPLNSEKFPPEACGYGVRDFCIDRSLTYLEIRQSLKTAVEHQIPLSEIVKPILPQTTMDIIKIQKSMHPIKDKKKYGGDLLEDFLILDTKSSISQLVKIGVLNRNSDLYKQKCLESNYYPFSIALG